MIFHDLSWCWPIFHDIPLFWITEFQSKWWCFFPWTWSVCDAADVCSQTCCVWFWVFHRPWVAFRCDIFPREWMLERHCPRGGPWSNPIDRPYFQFGRRWEEMGGCRKFELSEWTDLESQVVLLSEALVTKSARKDVLSTDSQQHKHFSQEGHQSTDWQTC